MQLECGRTVSYVVLYIQQQALREHRAAGPSSGAPTVDSYPLPSAQRPVINAPPATAHMVLQFVYEAAAAVVPPKYWYHTLAAALVLLVIYAYTQGRSTTRERDLHARVILLTVSGLSWSCGKVAWEALVQASEESVLRVVRGIGHFLSEVAG